MSWKIIHLGSWNLDIPCVTTIHEGPRGVRTVFSRLPKLQQRRVPCSSQVWNIWVSSTCCLFVKKIRLLKWSHITWDQDGFVFALASGKTAMSDFLMYTCGQTLGHRQTPKITEYKNGHTIQWHLETVDLSTWKQLCREATSSNHSEIQHLILLVEFFWNFGRHFVESLVFFLVAVYMEKLPLKVFIESCF